MELNTYQHRFLSDREVVKLFNWIPIHLILLLGNDDARTCIKTFILPLCEQARRKHAYPDKPTPLRTPVADDRLNGPYVYALWAIINNLIDYHAFAENYEEDVADKDDPVESAFKWMLENWDPYLFNAQAHIAEMEQNEKDSTDATE